MGYQKDLDWLARNVHEWPFGIQSYIYVITEDNGSKTWCGNVHYCAIRHRRVDKGEWLARRAELQAKAEPQSFTGLDEAIRKVLSVMRTEPEAFTSKELSEMKGICDAELAKLDTLEKRPDTHKSHEEIDTSPERVQKRPESIHVGHKADHGKPILGAIPPHAELSVARVLTFGAEKHARDGWQAVENAEVRYMDAALRHLNAHRRGELVDDESGESHLAHAACCIMFMLDMQERKRVEND